MDPMTAAYLVSLIISISASVLDAVGTSEANSKANREAKAIQEIATKVSQAQGNINKVISLSNNALSRLYNLRNIVDPRVVEKIDKQIGKVEGILNDASKTSSDNQAIIARAEGLRQNHSLGMAGLFGNKSNDKAIGELASQVSSFEAPIVSTAVSGSKANKSN